MTTKLTAVIPARSGSKRLLNKNIKKLAGRPLIFHTLDSVVAQKCIQEIIFTTDSEEYANLVIREYGNSINCIIRPESFATDQTKVTKEVKRLIDDKIIKTEWFLVSLPTSPLFTHPHMREYLASWSKSLTPSFTCHEYDFSPLFAFSINKDNEWESLLAKNSPMVTGNTRSQDLKQFYRPNGAAYISKCNIFLNTNIFYSGAQPYIIDNELGTDIDNIHDFKIAETLLGINNE